MDLAFCSEAGLKKCGLDASIFHFIHPVKKKRRLWEIVTSGHLQISHLTQLSLTLQTLLVSQLIQLNPPATPAPKLIPQGRGPGAARPMARAGPAPRAACPPQPRRQPLPCSPTPQVGSPLVFCRGFLVWSAGLRNITLYMHINVCIQTLLSPDHHIKDRSELRALGPTICYSMLVHFTAAP